MYDFVDGNNSIDLFSRMSTDIISKPSFGTGIVDSLITPVQTSGGMYAPGSVITEPESFVNTGYYER